MCRGSLKGVQFDSKTKILRETCAATSHSPLPRLVVQGLEVVHYSVQEQRWNVWLLDKGQLCTEAPIVETSISSTVFKSTTMVGVRVQHFELSVMSTREI